MINIFKRKKLNEKSSLDQLAHEIFKRINRRDFVYIIKATSNSYTSGLYEIKDELIDYSNETVEIFKTFSNLIQERLKGIGLFLIYQDEQNKLRTKSIKYYNPELFDKDLFELTIFQEFGFKPSEIERQGILEQSLKKESVKETLVYACYENNTDKILRLTKNAKKTQLDRKLEYTGTPLGLCVENKNVASFKAIAKAGATLSKKSLAFTPLQLAFKHSSEIVEYIHLNHKEVFEKEVSKQGFYIVADSTEIKMINLVYDFGADLNKYDKAFPHLHNFVDRNNITGIEFCLQKGVDINMKDSQGRTALDKAIMRGHKESIEYLQKKGAVESIK